MLGFLCVIVMLVVCLYYCCVSGLFLLLSCHVFVCVIVMKLVCLCYCYVRVCLCYCYEIGLFVLLLR